MKRSSHHLIFAALALFALAACDEQEGTTTDAATDTASEITDGVGLNNGEFTGGTDTGSDTSTGSDATPAFQQPQDATVEYGDRVSFELTGMTEGTSFQWYRGKSGDTSNLVGSSAKLVTPYHTETTNYWVRVSNSGGKKDSSTVTVTVKPPVAIVP